VSEAELKAGVRAYAGHGIRVEGAAAAPLALALRENLPKPLALIVTGRNIDDALYQRILTASP
jgi:threonine dehydratase